MLYSFSVDNTGNIFYKLNKGIIIFPCTSAFFERRWIEVSIRSVEERVKKRMLKEEINSHNLDIICNYTFVNTSDLCLKTSEVLEILKNKKDDFLGWITIEDNKNINYYSNIDSANTIKTTISQVGISLTIKCIKHLISISERIFEFDKCLVKNISKLINITKNHKSKEFNVFDHFKFLVLYLLVKCYTTFINIELFSKIVFFIFYLTYRHTRFKQKHLLITLLN